MCSPFFVCVCEGGRVREDGRGQVILAHGGVPHGARVLGQARESLKQLNQRKVEDVLWGGISAIFSSCQHYLHTIYGQHHDRWV